MHISNNLFSIILNFFSIRDDICTILPVVSAEPQLGDGLICKHFSEHSKQFSLPFWYDFRFTLFCFSALHDAETDRNEFEDEKNPGELSQMCLYFMGGVLELTPALCAVTNSTINSYKRICAPYTRSGATWSPNKISWGGKNT